MTQILRRGDNNEDVGEMQQSLLDYAHAHDVAIPSGFSVDNDFGGRTQTLLQAVQRHMESRGHECFNGATPDGVYGPNTASALSQCLGEVNAAAIAQVAAVPPPIAEVPQPSQEELDASEQAYLERISGPGGLQDRIIVWTDEQWVTDFFRESQITDIVFDPPPLVPPRPLRDHEFEQLERYGINTTALREMSPSDQYLFMEELGAERPVGQVTEYRGGILRPGMLVSSIADRMGKDADTLEEFDAHYQGIAEEHYADPMMWIGPNGLNLSSLPNYDGARDTANPYAPINIDTDIHVFSRDAAVTSWRALVADVQRNLILEGFTSAGNGLAATDIQLDENGMPVGVWNDASAEAYREWLVSRNVIGPRDEAIPLTHEIYNQITSVQQAYSMELAEIQNELPEQIAEAQIEAIAQRERLGEPSRFSWIESSESADRTRESRAAAADERAAGLLSQLQSLNQDLPTGDSSNGILNGRYSRTLTNEEFTALQSSLRAIGNAPASEARYSREAIEAFQAVRPVGYRSGADRYDAATRLALEYFEREEHRLTASPLTAEGYDNISTVERISTRAREANVSLLASGDNLENVTLVPSRRGDQTVLTADRALTLELVMATARAQQPELYERGLGITSAFRDADDNARVVIEEVGPSLARRWYNRSMPGAVEAIGETGASLRNYVERNPDVDFREAYAPVARAMERDGYNDSPNFHGPSGMKLDMFPVNRRGRIQPVSNSFERDWTEVALQMGGDTFDERPYGAGRPLDTNFTATNYAVRDHMLEVLARESRNEEGLQGVLSFFPEGIDRRFDHMYELTIRQGQGYDVQSVERVYTRVNEDGEVEVLAREGDDPAVIEAALAQLPTDIPESFMFTMHNPRTGETRELVLPMGDYIRYNYISPEYTILTESLGVDERAINEQGQLVISAPDLLDAINNREVTAYRRGSRGNYQEPYVMSSYIDSETLREDIPAMLQEQYADMQAAIEAGVLGQLEVPQIRAEVQEEERGQNSGMLLS